MGKDLYNLYPRSAKLVFEEADEALGNGLSSLIFEGEQVCIYLCLLILLVILYMTKKLEVVNRRLLGLRGKS